jgi:hypothetical protein
MGQDPLKRAFFITLHILHFHMLLSLLTAIEAPHNSAEPLQTYPQADKNQPASHLSLLLYSVCHI